MAEQGLKAAFEINHCFFKKNLNPFTVFQSRKHSLDMRTQSAFFRTEYTVCPRQDT